MRSAVRALRHVITTVRIKQLHQDRLFGPYGLFTNSNQLYNCTSMKLLCAEPTLQFRALQTCRKSVQTCSLPVRDRLFPHFSKSMLTVVHVNARDEALSAYEAEQCNMFLHPAARLAWLHLLQSRGYDVVTVLSSTCTLIACLPAVRSDDEYSVSIGWKGNKCHPFNSRRGRLKDIQYMV